LSGCRVLVYGMHSPAGVWTARMTDCGSRLFRGAASRRGDWELKRPDAGRAQRCRCVPAVRAGSPGSEARAQPAWSRLLLLAVNSAGMCCCLCDCSGWEIEASATSTAALRKSLCEKSATRSLPPSTGQKETSQARQCFTPTLRWIPRNPRKGGTSISCTHGGNIASQWMDAAVPERVVCCHGGLTKNLYDGTPARMPR